MINGNFEQALTNLIRNLVDGEKSKTEILGQWDYERGNDWFTSTKSSDQYEGERDVD